MDILVKCVYYKPTGKWYAAAEKEFPAHLFMGCIYPKDYGRRLNQLEKLPGLASGTWEGPFTCEIEYPELILPEPNPDDEEDNSVDSYKTGFEDGRKAYIAEIRAYIEKRSREDE